MNRLLPAIFQESDHLMKFTIKTLSICICSIPILFAYIISNSCHTFLQSQSNNVIISFLAALSIIIHVPLLVIHNAIQVWDSWGNDFNNFGILDSRYWSTDIYYMWLVPWNMERFLFYHSKIFACCQAFHFIRCHVMVSFFLCQLKGLISSL